MRRKITFIAELPSIRINKCTVKGCNRKIHVKQLCKHHYQMYWVKRHRKKHNEYQRKYAKEHRDKITHYTVKSSILHGRYPYRTHETRGIQNSNRKYEICPYCNTSMWKRLRAKHNKCRMHQTNIKGRNDIPLRWR